ncbi:hypothetical protein TGDOM2_398840 [Toxoplasma gondii GAB2-2007-GAL-DOM2]|uniref:Transmembrane protein n=1 Tax=Toxoplasma gondii GAB2-2007-GAL-DOM2 TaxID=1130820 RepID=A0A086KD84_TOXGO|nr:hypothetical protein TGDOM2_398840 [Toxoplasma gondii GAB2-2007-GAL-DOM2]
MRNAMVLCLTGLQIIWGGENTAVRRAREEKMSLSCLPRDKRRRCRGTPEQVCVPDTDVHVNASHSTRKHKTFQHDSADMFKSTYFVTWGVCMPNYWPHRCWHV